MSTNITSVYICMHICCVRFSFPVFPILVYNFNLFMKSFTYKINQDIKLKSTMSYSFAFIIFHISYLVHLNETGKVLCHYNYMNLTKKSLSFNKSGEKSCAN